MYAYSIRDSRVFLLYSKNRSIRDYLAVYRSAHARNWLILVRKDEITRFVLTKINLNI